MLRTRFVVLLLLVVFFQCAVTTDVGIIVGPHHVTDTTFVITCGLTQNASNTPSPWIVTLTCSSSHYSLRLLTWDTPFSPLADEHTFLLRDDTDDVIVKYVGPIAHRTNVVYVNEQLVRFGRGVDVVIPVDLSRTYHLLPSHRYDVQLLSGLKWFVLPEDDNNTWWRVEVTGGKALSFEIPADHQPSQPYLPTGEDGSEYERRSDLELFEASRATCTPPIWIYWPPGTSTCTQTQKNFLLGDISTAVDGIDAFLNNFVGAGCASGAFEQYFGLFEPSRYDTIKSKYQSIRGKLCSNTWKIFCYQNNQYCYAGLVAYTDLQTSTVYLCPLFLNTLTGGLHIDSRPGTLIHETSHIVGTIDTVKSTNPPTYYAGSNDAKTLAVWYPEKAKNHADCFEYNIETSPVCSTSGPLCIGYKVSYPLASNAPGLCTGAGQCNLQVLVQLGLPFGTAANVSIYNSDARTSHECVYSPSIQSLTCTPSGGTVLIKVQFYSLGRNLRTETYLNTASCSSISGFTDSSNSKLFINNLAATTQQISDVVQRACFEPCIGNWASNSTNYS